MLAHIVKRGQKIKFIIVSQFKPKLTAAITLLYDFRVVDRDQLVSFLTLAHKYCVSLPSVFQSYEKKIK